MRETMSFILFFFVSASVSADVLNMNYVSGIADKVSKPDLTSILIRDVGDKDRLARSFVSGWIFKKRKLVPVKGKFIELSLTDKEYVTIIQTGWSKK